MGNIGFTELLVILVIILVIFGPSKLPQIGEALGKAFGDFKKAMQKGEDEIDNLKADLKMDTKEKDKTDENLKG